jgi:gliding motility-associated-like protein
MKSTLHVFAKFLLSLSFFCDSFSSIAQLEGNYWYFGRNAGITFKTGTAVAITDGQMTNWEGVASMSNKKGELLFYTDGEFVYNKSHNIMTNGSGLKGDNSSTQSAIIVQQPIRGWRYYIFTTDAGESNYADGLQYSIVDTNQSSGYGAVLSSDKNRYLMKSGEKVAAVKHANKVDTWIVTQEWGSDKFNAYLLSATGLNNTPVSSPIATPIGPGYPKNQVGYGKGFLKFSPDGKKMVNPVVGNQSSNTDGYWELYDFDNLTGKLSNRIVFNNSNRPASVANYNGIYGAEFSSNGRFLYLSCRNTGGGTNNKIWQFDMKNPNFTDINNSVVEIAASGSGINGSFGGLQLAVDGKIYVAKYGANNLAIIEKPNCKGTASNFINNGIGLAGKTSYWGLPTFIASFFSKPEFEFGDSTGAKSGVCFGDKTQFWLGDTAGVDSVHWIFGDPASGSNNFSSTFRPEHLFTKDTTFSVQAIIFRKGSIQNCLLDTVSRLVTIFPVPKFNIGNDTTICDGEDIFINALSIKGYYAWHDNTNNPNFTGTKSDTVWLRVTSGGCSSADTLILTVVPFPTIELGPDTIVCEGTPVRFESGKADSYLWSNSKTDSAIIVVTPGKYWVRSTTFRCESTDTVELKNSKYPKFSLGNDTTLCTSDSLILRALVPGATLDYLWSTTETSPFIQVKNPGGTYWVLVKDTVCSWSDTAKVSFSAPKPLDLGADKKVCNGDTASFNALVVGATKYKWHNNTTLPTFKTITQGQVFVDVFDGFCNLTDSAFVYVTTPLVVNLGNDTILCLGQQVDTKLKYTVQPNYEYKWNGIPNQKDTIIKTSGNYWMDVTDLPDRVCKTTDSIRVTFQSAIVFSLGNDTVLCLGQQIFLNATSVGPVVSSRWQDGTTGLSRNNDPAIVKHWLDIDNGICKSSDTINISYKTLMTFDLGPNQQLCDNNTLGINIITTPTATSYIWKDINGIVVSNVSSYIITNPGGRYDLTVSDGVCTKWDTINVVYFTTPVVDLGQDTILCDDAVLDLGNPTVDADKFQWKINGINDATTPTLQVNDPGGEYELIVSKGPCPSSDKVIVGYTTAPDFDLGWSDTTLCEATLFKFDFSDLKYTNFLWNDGTNESIKEVKEKGLHWMIATNICGADSIGFNIIIDELGCFVNFPNAFSPNGDGINDIFRPIGRVLEFVEMNIYNRYGELIFSGPPIPGWDGTYGKSNPVMPGVYYWMVTYRQLSGGYPRRFTENGIVHVVR